MDDPNEEEEPTNDAHEGEECKKLGRVVEEDGVPPTRASLRLKDLDKLFGSHANQKWKRTWNVIRSGLFVVGMMPCFCVARSEMMLRGVNGQRPPVRVGECSSCPRNYPGTMTLASWP